MSGSLIRWARRAALAGLVALAASVTWLARRPLDADGARGHSGDPFAMPAFEGRHVHDGAAALGPFGELLDALAAQWTEELGIDVQIATLAAPAEPLPALGLRIFEARRVGAASPTGGLLYLLETGGGRARIEVSYALEGSFPDAFVGRIAEDQLAPYARSGAAGMALMDALHHMKDFALLQVRSGALRPPSTVLARLALQRALGGLAGGAGAQVDLSALSPLADLKAPVPTARAESRYAPASDPLQSAQAYERVLADLAGDPALALFTPGSQLQRARYPVAPFEYWQQARTIADSHPLHAAVQADRAVVTSNAPAPGFVPILLWRGAGLWRVDLVETWKNLFFGADGNYFVMNRNNPYMFGLAALPAGSSHPLEALELGERPLDAEIAALEATLHGPHGAAEHFRLAELLFRNCFAAVAAMDQYAAAARHEPGNGRYVFTMGDRALYLGFARYALVFYGAMPIEFAAERMAEAHSALGEYAKAQRLYRRALVADPSSAERIEPKLAWLGRKLEGER